MRSVISLVWPLLFLFSGSAAAHDINTSYTTVEIIGDRIQCTLRVDQTDLVRLFDIDENEDGEIGRDEIWLNLDKMQDHFLSRIVVTIAGEPVQLAKATPSLFEDELGNVFADFHYRADLLTRPWKITVGLSIFSDFGPRHKNLAKIIYEGGVQQTIFTVGDPEQTFGFSGEAVSLASQIGQFIWLGMEHIFIGYDHILFLIGLIVIGGGFLNLVKIVTSFTVAHSITLILAALQIVMIPSRVVESVIALSIVYIAVENFLIKEGDQRWLITGIFGLMHGFGFAGVLTELGLPTRGLVASLLSFNIGVEIGQVLIVALVYPLILWAARSRWQRQVVYGLSSVILIFGLVWFIERAFGLEFVGI